MIHQQVYILNTFRIFIDALCIIFAGYSAKYAVTYYVPGVAWLMDENVFIASLLTIMLINNYAMGKLNMYGERKLSGLYGIVLPVLQAVLIDFSIGAGIVFLAHPPDYPRSFLVLFVVFSFAYMVVSKFVTQIYIEFVLGKGFNVRRVLIVGDMKRGHIVSNLLDSQVSWGHQVVGRLTTSSQRQQSDHDLGTIEQLPKIIREKAVDEVIFAMDGDRSVNLSEYLNFCKQVGVSVKILPAMWDQGEHGLSVESLQGIPFFTMQSASFNANGIMYKRVLDIVGGIIGFFIFLIIFPFVAAAIKLDSLGSVIFRQKRMGQNGRIFNLYKFRSMYQDAESRKQALMDKNEMDGLMFKLKDDPRITKVGRFLRKTSLDEFPQFINVLKGEMSLVGTRPPTLDEVEQYEPHHLKRISAKPGITGLWQVSGRNKITDFDKIVELDCRYLDKWRFFDDIKILFLTVVTVLKRKGAV